MHVNDYSPLLRALLLNYKRGTGVDGICRWLYKPKVFEIGELLSNKQRLLIHRSSCRWKRLRRILQKFYLHRGKLIHLNLRELATESSLMSTEQLSKLSYLSLVEALNLADLMINKVEDIGLFLLRLGFSVVTKPDFHKLLGKVIPYHGENDRLLQTVTEVSHIGFLYCIAYNVVTRQVVGAEGSLVSDFTAKIAPSSC